MTISLTRLAWSVWGGRGKEEKPVSKVSALNSSPSSEWGIANDTKKMAPPHRKERRVHREYGDVTLVPFDDDFSSGWCLCGSESADSEWSIGWLEPLGSGFQSDDIDGDGFAVLVPCYKPSCKEVGASNKALLSAIKNLSNGFSSAGKSCIEQWLASLQNFEA